MGRRKTQKELIEVLWESRYGAKKAAPRGEEPKQDESPIAYGGRPATRPAPEGDEEIDLARLEGDEWEGLPALVPDPIPQEARAVDGAGGGTGLDSERGVPARPSADDEPGEESVETEEAGPECTGAKPAPARPAPPSRAPAGPGPIRRFAARLAAVRDLVARSFSATTVGEFLSKTVEVRVGTIAVVFAGIAIFGILCFLLGQGTRSSDEVPPLDERAGLFMTEKIERPAIRNATERLPAVPPAPKAPGSEGRGVAPEPKSEAKRTPPSTTTQADLSWTIQVASWTKKGGSKDAELIEKLRQGLGVSPVWSEESATRVTVFAGRYASEQDARADLQKIREARVQGFQSFQDAYPFKKVRATQAGSPAPGR